MDSATAIAFLGSGNMARALIGGLIGAGHQAASISVYDVDILKSTALRDELGIQAAHTPADLLHSAALVLAVKPQQMQQALVSLALTDIATSPLMISIAAGIPLSALQNWSQQTQPIVRCMPNTPALVRAGASVLCANAQVSDDQKVLASSVLRAVGSVDWVQDEADLDAVTAISGSGPAYYFLFQELMEKSAQKLGLEPALAARLVRQTALGAAQLAAQSDQPVEELRKQVTSPGGTTEQALRVFQEQGLAALVERATQAARDRSIELARQLDENS